MSQIILNVVIHEGSNFSFVIDVVQCRLIYKLVGLLVWLVGGAPRPVWLREGCASVGGAQV